MAYAADLAAFVWCLLLFAAYIGFLRARLKRNPLYTMQALNHAARTAWVRHVMEEQNQGILAVQTLRNSTMVATFLASTAVLLMVGTLNLAQAGGGSEGVLHFFGQIAPGLWRIKVLLLVAIFFAAFFAFVISVRFYNHVGYQIAFPINPGESLLTINRVSTSLNRAGKFYTIGMRAYFLSVPFVFWMFGPMFMAASMPLVIYVLYRLDKAPAP